MGSNIMNVVLCAVADNVIVNGASAFFWGEKEIPDSLKEKYQKVQEEKENEKN